MAAINRKPQNQLNLNFTRIRFDVKKTNPVILGLVSKDKLTYLSIKEIFNSVYRITFLPEKLIFEPNENNFEISMKVGQFKMAFFTEERDTH